jgi:hypothetical protein
MPARRLALSNGRSFRAIAALPSMVLQDVCVIGVFFVLLVRPISATVLEGIKIVKSVILVVPIVMERSPSVMVCLLFNQ